MRFRRYLCGVARLWAVLIVLCCAGAALAQPSERRVALVIGNAAYAAVSPLANPVNDANAIAHLLKEAGFETVDVHRDLDRIGMLRALRSFEDKLQGAAIGLIYFSGHGMEINRENFLIPVDAKLAAERDADDEAVSLNRVLRSLDAATRLRLVILDACRDNRFAPVGRQGRQRSATRGLARIEPPSTDTLIAYAARDGTTASDGTGANSPFTSALLRHLSRPGLDIRLAFGYIRDDVLKTTGNAQEPYLYGSLGGGTIALSATGISASPSDIVNSADLHSPISVHKRQDDVVGQEQSLRSTIILRPYSGIVSRRERGKSIKSRKYTVKFEDNNKAKIYVRGDLNVDLILTGNFIDNNSFKGKTGANKRKSWRVDNVIIRFSDDRKSLVWQHDDGRISGTGTLRN